MPPTALLRWPGFAIASLFFAAGLMVSSDIGLTADEFETIRAGERNLEIAGALLAGDDTPEWSFHELTGYYYVLDTGRALVATGLNVLGLDDPVRSLHLAHLLLASLALFLLYRVAIEAGASTRAASLCTGVLATLPQFVAHSQNNPKDLPALLVFVMVVHAVLLSRKRSPAMNALAGGAALALAMTSRVLSGFALLVGWAFLAITEEQPTRRLVGAQGAMLGVGLLGVLLLWPWLWPSPIDNLSAALGNLTTKVFTIPVLYLGEVHPANELPWHYRAALLGATTPTLYLLLACTAIAPLMDNRAPTGLRRTALLGAAWLAVMALADGLAWSRYDGLRHFLPALPGFALLIGCGAEYALRFGEQHGIRRLSRALVALAFVLAVAGIGRVHPYANAYLNSPAMLWSGEGSEKSFEIEYWGQSYLEGIRWLEANAEPDARLVAPLFPKIARYYTERPVYDDVRAFFDRSQPSYLMLISRRAYYDDALRHIEEKYQPLFTIERSRGRLLSIYRNEAAEKASTRR